eukprot:ctg_2233.g580
MVLLSATYVVSSVIYERMGLAAYVDPLARWGWRTCWRAVDALWDAGVQKQSAMRKRRWLFAMAVNAAETPVGVGVPSIDTAAVPGDVKQTGEDGLWER